MGRPDRQVGAGEQRVDVDAGLDGDQPDPRGQLDEAAGREDRLLHDRQAPGGQPVGIGIAAGGEDGERTAAHPRDAVLTAHGGTQARPISAMAVETISRPAFSRARRGRRVRS